MILFAGGHEHIEEARAYIRKQGFTKEDVRLVKRGNDIHVITKDGLNPWTRRKHLSLKELSSRNRL